MKTIQLPDIPQDVTGGTRQFCENIRSWLSELMMNGIFRDLPIYADNAAAIADGLIPGNFYRTDDDPDFVCVVH
jgi:hypothetical protein